MGLLNSILGKRRTTPAEYIPAGAPERAVTRASDLGHQVLNRAGSVYQRNPKLVKTIASGALLIAAAAFAKKKGYM